MNSEDEEQNATKILSQQRLSQLAKDKAHINLLKEIDKKRPQYIIKGEKETFSQGNSILAAAQRAKENALDASKEMSTLLRCSKVASIRDLQREEHKRMEKNFREKEAKLDLMMELERLKELRFQEDKEKEEKLKRYSSAKILIEQIKEKEMRRLQEKEIIAREGELMKQQIKAMQEEELRNEERKRLENARLAKEIVNINKISALNRDKKKILEREEDLKRLKYNMERAKKEEEEIAEQKRIQAAREKETQKLREKQEKFADKQALLDELRAKRAFEEAEKKEREKERQEMLKLEKQKKELIEGNEKQKLAKRKRLEEQAFADQKEYEYIIKHQIADMEEERRLEEIKRKIFNANGEEVRRQIQEKLEKVKLRKRTIIDERREIQQDLDDYKKTIERIKKEGISPIQPKTGQKVSVHYKGYFKDGIVFDQSRKKKKSKPFVFKVGIGEVIKGWDVGVASMKKGESATFYIKSDYAYGNEGAGDDIPPNTDLYFD